MFWPRAGWLSPALITVGFFLVLVGTSSLAAPPAGATSRTGSGSGVGVAGGAGGASHGTATALQLTYQSPWVQPGQAYDLQLQTQRSTAATPLNLQVTVYNRVIARSQFERSLTAVPSTADVLDQTAAIQLSRLRASGRPGGVDLSVGVTPGPGSTGPAPPDVDATLDLGCGNGNGGGACTGVYPIVVTLQRPDGSEMAHLSTFLSYAGARSANPLRFAFIVPFAGEAAGTASSASPTPASPTSPGAFDQLAAALESHAGVPVTIEAVPRTLQTLASAPGTAGRQAVAQLAALSDDPAIHEVPAQTYVPIDPSAMETSGLSDEVAQQRRRGTSVLATLGVHTLAGTFITQGPVGDNLGSGLSAVDASQVALPDGDLSAATVNFGSSRPFNLVWGRDGQASAAAIDSQLSALTVADRSDPVLAANDLLAELAFIYSETPSEQQGVVVMPPQGSVLTAAFADPLLAGLEADPFVQPVTLQGLFSSAYALDGSTYQLNGRNGYELDGESASSRHLAQGTPTTLAGSVVAHIDGARARLDSFDSAVPSAPGVMTQLDEQLLSAEAAALGRRGQTVAVSQLDRALDQQLSLVRLATERTITLTAQRARIPVTILSAAPYPLEATLTVVSDKLQFPGGTPGPAGTGTGGEVVRHVTIDHSTNPVYVEVQARNSGDLPVQVILRSPQGGLVITGGRLTVRSTVTSLAGIVLTLVALAVLLGWWARTWRRRRAARGASARHA